MGGVLLPPLKESKKEELTNISSGEDEDENEEEKQSPVTTVSDSLN